MFIFLLVFFVVLHSNCYANSNDDTFVLIVSKSKYVVDIYRNGEKQKTLRVIVGRRGHETPTFKTTITHIEINPIWDVPKSIARHLFAKIKRSKKPIDFIRRKRYDIYDKTQLIDPTTIDWKTFDPQTTTLSIKQRPGDDNALGHIMFFLSNNTGIQMHDTPNKRLFSRKVRKFSSGCIRVDRAVEIASDLLGISVEDVNQMIASRKNRWIKLDRRVDVYVTQ